MVEELIIVKTEDQLSQLYAYICDKDFIAYDVETTGLSKEDTIIGFSVCAEIEKAYYVILQRWDTGLRKLIPTELHNKVIPILNLLKTKQLIMHNAVFDCWMTKNNFGVDLIPSLHTDTMILGHVLNENRSNGLKERGIELYGENVSEEQRIMKESVVKNGGLLTKKIYELYKADSELLAYYGAKDAMLTLKIFYNDVPELFAYGLDSFFYEEESMPLLRRTTYDLNTIGLRVDPEKLQTLKATLEADCIEAKDFILKETYPYVKEKYPGTGKTNHFNIGATQQLAWLLFFELDNEFTTLTDGGKELCKALKVQVPYSRGAKNSFIQMCVDQKGFVYKEGYLNKKTGKNVRPKKVEDPWKYLTCGVETIARLSKKYKWVQKLGEYKKNLKLLNTYVEGIQDRMQYNVIRPSFLQHGTTSGRYSSKNPNFQNLPREDKRVKACIVSRPGKVFVGADYSQLEPRVFASFSKDERLQRCFSRGEDFHSVVGVEIFNRPECSIKKEDKNSYAKLYAEEREVAKKVDLAAVYGANAFRLAKITGKSQEEMEQILDKYFNDFPDVYNFMIESYEAVKKDGQVVSLFGRPRRLPEALKIEEIYGKTEHKDLPYEIRGILNLAVNHRVQSTGASIVNRASIAFYNKLDKANITDCHIVMQVHDSITVECLDKDKHKVSELLQDAMENTSKIPGVNLVAVPTISKDLAGQK